MDTNSTVLELGFAPKDSRTEKVKVKPEPEREKRARDYYQLKGNLVDVQLEAGSTKLVLVFDKKSDPKYSAQRIKDLQGFVVCSIRKPAKEDKSLHSEKLEKEYQKISVQDRIKPEYPHKFKRDPTQDGTLFEAQMGG